MKWQYIIIRQEGPEGPVYGIHEGIIEKGEMKVTSWTEESVIGYFESMEEIYKFLQRLVGDFKGMEVYSGGTKTLERLA